MSDAELAATALGYDKNKGLTRVYTWGSNSHGQLGLAGVPLDAQVVLMLTRVECGATRGRQPLDKQRCEMPHLSGADPSLTCALHTLMQQQPTALHPGTRG